MWWEGNYETPCTHSFVPWGKRAGKATCLPSINGWCSMLTRSDVPGVTAPLGVFFKSSSSFSPLEKGSLEKTFGSFSPLEATSKSCWFCWEVKCRLPQQPKSEDGTGSALRAFRGKRNKFTSAYSPSRKSTLVLSKFFDLQEALCCLTSSWKSFHVQPSVEEETWSIQHIPLNQVSAICFNL